MQKEALRQLKGINASPPMKRLAEFNRHEISYPSRRGAHTRNTLRDILIRCQIESVGKNSILAVYVFLPDKVARGISTPIYEIYCDLQAREYITRMLDDHGKEQKWSNAMADNLEKISSIMSSHYWYRNVTGYPDRIWQPRREKGIIQNFLKTKENGIYGLIEWQRRVKSEKMEEKEKRQQEPWDRNMALIPEVFPSFYTWMEKDGHNHHYIIYEYDKKGAKEGYCSHCHRLVPVEKPIHNKESRCIKCGAKITYKVASKIQTLSTGWYDAQVIQRIRGGIVVRTFEQYQYYRDCDYRTPRKITKEIERILLLDEGKTKRYYYGLYKNKFHRWILDRNYAPSGHTYYMSLVSRLYKRNLSALKKHALKNTAIDLWEELPTDTANYLVLEHYRPVIEKLARIGMFNLAKDFITKNYKIKLLDEKQTELTKILRIDPARLKRLKAIDGKAEHLAWYQHEKLTDTVWPDEMIRDFGNSNFDHKSFDFIPTKISLVKVWNYLKKQVEISHTDMSKLLTTWQDYLNMAKKNKMDVKNDMISRPKDVHAAHQRLIMLSQGKEMEKEAKSLEKKWPQVNNVLPGLQKFEYADKKYAILVPKSILDIVREGHALQHCVHTCDFYFDRIQRNESYLFFLRRAGAEDIPWYTLEVEPSGNIRQKRTTGDNQGKDLEEAKEFLRKWQKEFQKRLTQKEKRLGEKADQARIREYAKLRKDGNKVWHGRLAGQLLADVLEQDFMAAGS